MDYFSFFKKLVDPLFTLQAFVLSKPYALHFEWSMIEISLLSRVAWSKPTCSSAA